MSLVTAIYVPEIVSGLVAKANERLSLRTTPVVAIFDKGHYIEMVRNQTAKQFNTDKPARYPLIWLVMDIKETLYPRLGVYADVEVQIIIAKDTLKEYTVDERAANVFKPILYPIYDELMLAIERCPFLFNSLPVNNKHVKYDRLYWGGQDSYGNGEANMFNDFVDAIQIKGLILQVKKNYCQTLSI